MKHSYDNRLKDPLEEEGVDRAWEVARLQEMIALATGKKPKEPIFDEEVPDYSV